MHIQYKKRQLHFLLLLVVLFFSTTKTNAQSIVGPTQVVVGDVAHYTFLDPSNNTFLPGGWENDGRLLVDESQGYLPYTDARWDTVGTHYLGITCFDNDGNIVDYITITVNVTYVEAPTPPGPRVQSNTLGVATLAWELYSAPPSGVTWYWQDSSNGTSTANSSSTINVTSGSVYYLRSRNNTTNTWSTNSSSVNYTFAPPPTWYYDTDGDGFGNRSPTLISYTQPAGYVNNDKDACPDQAGTFDGCLTNNNENYVRTIQYQKPYSESDFVNAIPNSDKIESISYFDGLGRPKQNIGIRAGGNGEDIVTPIGYDEYGRKDKEYLPYAIMGSNNNGLYKSNALVANNTFYNTPKYENTANSYAQKEFEASPLNRVLKQAAPGYDWRLGSGHEIKLEYATNTVTDQVRRFGVSFTNGNTEAPQLQDNGIYAPSQLYKTITKDENWTAGHYYPNDHTTEEFKNKDGKVVLKRTFDVGKWHDTYYVYDTYGNLTYVLSPKAVSPIITTHFFYEDFYGNFTNDITNCNCPNSGYIIMENSPGILDFNLIWSGFADGSVFNTGKVADLNTSLQLPDMILGNIMSKDSNGNPAVAAIAYIQNGDLYFTSTGVGIYGDVVYGEFGFSTTIHLSNYQNSPINNVALNDLCYQYKYDKRNRLVEKKLPGKEWEYIVYDKLDRPVLTQDANLRTSNKWLFTKYDAFNRPVYTGEYINTTSGQTTRTEMQTLADGVTSLFETKQGINTINGTTVYYSNNAFPNINNTNINLFTINYYDDYNFDLNGGAPVTSYTVSPITNAKGLATGSKVRTLGTTNWTTNVIYYDSKGRAIYNYSKNDFLSTTSTVKFKMDFVGKTLETTSTHFRNNVTTTVVDNFTYDNVGRLLTQKQKINNQDQETITSNTYDELGQLNNKGVGGKTTQSRLQTVDYTYNIRGWLKGINDTDTSNNNITMGSGDLFGFQINYNNPSTGTALYNGNISQTFWKNLNLSTTLKNYTYSYDALNRLKSASSQDSGRYNESLSYDKNGNIANLYRYGYRDANATQLGNMDNLVYGYDAGNKLISVQDYSGSTEGFKDGSHTAQEYTYDLNGNMKTDDNKGITAITYNHLNLPTDVTLTGGTIHYDYDATGVKQRKMAAGITTDYAEGFQYEKIGTGAEMLKFFPTPEGYAEYNNSTFSYIYQYKDHLGNVRLSYKDGSATSTPSLQIVEESNYYPFGMKQKVAGEVLNQTGYKYKYNGKEFQDDNIGGVQLNLYDYGARNYDPSIGRWMNIDPLAEKYFSASPYNYVLNSPLNSIDPYGMDVYFLTEDGRTILGLNEKDKNTDTLYAINSRNVTSVSGISEQATPSIFDMKDTNGDGEFSKEDGITVKSGLIGQLTKSSGTNEEGDYTISVGKQKENENDYLNLFLYISNNAKKNEFSLEYYTKNNQNWMQLGTYNDSEKSPMAIAKNSVTTLSYHNHSNTVNNRIIEFAQMGAYPDGRQYFTGQWHDFDYSRENKTPYTKYVYYANSKRLYSVTQYTVKYVQQINNTNDLKQ